MRTVRHSAARSLDGHIVIGLIVVAALQPRLSHAQTREELTRQVQAAESAFASTMARRDLAAFTSYLAEEAVFFGRSGAQRGKTAVVEAWRTLFDGAAAPFSWRPEVVEVLDSGTLGLTSGPVLDPAGRRIGTFNSIWRREAGGRWKIVFDKGCPGS